MGNVVFGAGSQFAFSSGAIQQLVLASGSASFASSFGVASVLGLGDGTVEGTYTLLSGAVNATNLSNVGAGSAVAIGSGGKSAYLQQVSAGNSLQLVVVPEPGVVTLAGLGAAAAAWALHRRRRARG